eukprot:TRINITY_DN1257_c0_g1_i1.p1 TRINITY_DN1257_c0_g1~~TRINITY_DN1257_c0_g1_i1.p1  ORF type:complete len:270 (-),score=62.95 TRINITY_DN1257_c0_g1_i1:37-846(-)
MRFKQFRKTVAFYKLNFGFEEPYNVIADELFIETVAAKHIEALRLLPRIFSAKVRVCILTCVKDHLLKKHKGNREVISLVNALDHVPCEHENQKSSNKCLYSFLEDKDFDLQYCCAVQHTPLRSRIGKRIAGVPIVYISNVTVLMLEKASVASVNYINNKELRRNSVVPSSIKKKITSEGGEGERDPVTGLLLFASRQKGKRAKAPNPLSNKKKQPRKLPPPPKTAEEKKEKAKKRTRNRKRKREGTSAGAGGGEGSLQGNAKRLKTGE